MKCVNCGKEFVVTNRYDYCSDECFIEGFWKEKEGKGFIRVGNESYYAEPYKSTPNSMMGFGGRLFIFQSEADPNRVWYSNDVWHQGKIPEKFLNLFEPVKTITKEEYDKIIATGNAKVINQR